MNTQRIFITGGASGLGKAIAEIFAKAGYQVCIGDIDESLGKDTEAILKKRHPDNFFIRCDVTKLEDLKRVKQVLIEKWGGLDVLVNNAGVAGTAAGVEEIPLEDWDWAVNINLMGPVRGCSLFTPLFVEQGSGHIVNIASAAGLLNAPRISNYNVTKAAVISLSESLRVEFAHYPDINVSVICPGFFPTNLSQSIRSKDDKPKQWVENIMQRTGITAEDVAQLTYQAVDKNIFWVLPHPLERRMWTLKRYLPQFFFQQMAKRTKHFLSLTSARP